MHSTHPRSPDVAIQEHAEDGPSVRGGAHNRPALDGTDAARTVRPPHGFATSNLTFSNGVWRGVGHPAMEAVYHEVRLREGRLLDDAVVRDLPISGIRSGHRDEWLARRASMRRVIREFRKAHRSMTVLDVGCGNGWLAARIAEQGHSVVGIGIHRHELEQAAKVFGHERLWWIHGDMVSASFVHGSFDRIIAAGALQYFEQPAELCHRLMHLLAPQGELHVFDSPLYRSEAGRDRAEEESAEYYRSLNTPGMMAYYHHHCMEELMSPRAHCSVSHPLLMARLLLKAGLRVRQFPYVIFRHAAIADGP